jgi:hypothetical protein
VWEAITFHHEELDNQVVPVEDIQGLPNPLIILSSSYEDENGDQWLFGLVTDEQSGRWLHAWTVKNGKIFDRDILNGRSEMNRE